MIRILSAIILSVVFAGAAQAATIAILPGAGFTDTRSIGPVGGNTATTLGQARLQVFQQAALFWGSKISSSQVIYVNVNFSSLSCSSSSGMLGWARPNVFIKNFTNMPKLDVYYPEALANALAGKRIDGSNPLADPAGADIQAEFNSVVDSSSGCLHGVGFYYGLDNNPSGSKIDLLNVVMHEMGHGLGFISFVDESTGQGDDSNYPDHLGIYDQFVYDETQGKYWTQLTAAQRASSAVNDGRLAWNGTNVNGAVSALTSGVTASRHLQLYAPNPGVSGSSVSHWDDNASPDLLMEPFATPTMKASRGVDFTACAMADMGWPIAAGVGCPDSITTNAAPIAYVQNLQTNENTQLAVTLTASDLNSDPLTFSVVTAPTHGSLTGTPPNLIYVPDANYLGTDSFKFVANDGKVNSVSAAVNIAINSPSAGGTPGTSTGSGDSSGGGGGAMPNLLFLLMLAGLRQLYRLRASRP